MIQQSKGKIFLAEERGITLSDSSSSLNTFNFGKYFNEHKKAFGDLYAVNEDTLDAGCSLSLTAEEYSYIVLLPVMGAIALNDSSGNRKLVAAGQSQILTLDNEETLEITNPFSEGLVNFLQVFIKAGKTGLSKESYLCTYNVNDNIDNLIKVSPSYWGEFPLPFDVFVGKFNGRGETGFQLRNERGGLFVFVIEGAFEVQDRLLHAGDGLALWEIEKVEIEALSNDAIIMVIDLSFR